LKPTIDSAGLTFNFTVNVDTANPAWPSTEIMKELPAKKLI
jgi:hypothetical protein